MLQKLRVLNLRDNYLSGKLLPQLEDLKLLSVLDLANNNIYDNFPSSMQYLSLSRIQVLDLANNDLSGEIPQCLGNLSN